MIRIGGLRTRNPGRILNWLPLQINDSCMYKSNGSPLCVFLIEAAGRFGHDAADARSGCCQRDLIGRSPHRLEQLANRSKSLTTISNNSCT